LFSTLIGKGDFDGELDSTCPAGFKGSGKEEQSSVKEDQASA
jgi:hypothetical protein